MAEKPTTKLCKHCKTEIPYDAKICPNCRKSQKPNGCLIAILVVVVLFILVGAIGGGSSKNDTASAGTASSTAQTDSAAVSQETEAAPTPEPKTTYTVGETAEDKNIKVTLVSAEQSTGSQFLTPADGNVFVVLEFEIENDSDTDISVSSIASFEAYCDDYSVNMNLAANVLYDNKNQLDGSVAAGKKMNGVIGYEVPADFKTLEVKFTPSFWSNRAITFEIPNQ
ncbi:DUF4352 domain-containing protein [Gemmiger sp.]